MVVAWFAGIMEDLTLPYSYKYLAMFSKIWENNVWEQLYANMQNGFWRDNVFGIDEIG
jgi:hypothetical protein